MQNEETYSLQLTDSVWTSRIAPTIAPTFMHGQVNPASSQTSRSQDRLSKNWRRPLVRDKPWSTSYQSQLSSFRRGSSFSVSCTPPPRSNFQRTNMAIIVKFKDRYWLCTGIVKPWKLCKKHCWPHLFSGKCLHNTQDWCI